MRNIEVSVLEFYRRKLQFPNLTRSPQFVGLVVT